MNLNPMYYKFTQIIAWVRGSSEILAKARARGPEPPPQPPHCQGPFCLCLQVGLVPDWAGRHRRSHHPLLLRWGNLFFPPCMRQSSQGLMNPLIYLMPQNPHAVDETSWWRRVGFLPIKGRAALLLAQCASSSPAWSGQVRSFILLATQPNFNPSEETGPRGWRGKPLVLIIVVIVIWGKGCFQLFSLKSGWGASTSWTGAGGLHLAQVKLLMVSISPKPHPDRSFRRCSTVSQGTRPDCVGQSWPSITRGKAAGAQRSCRPT